MHHIYTFRGHTLRAFQIGLLALALLLTGGVSAAWAQHGDDHDDGHGSGSRFSDKPIPLIPTTKRPRPIIELGPKFLGSGNINDGFEIPTGAVWTPALMVFGQVRAGVNVLSSSTGDNTSSLGEAVGRFDLFSNLYLTQTERIVVGFRPLDQEGRFTRFELFNDPELPDSLNGFQEELNFELRTLFFEGDIAEIFPNLDYDDSSPLDVYFSVGRQPLSFQEGFLLNEDALDMVGLTRANMKIGGFVNTRATAVFAWNDINRLGAGNIEDEDGLLFGLFTETDTRKRTVELDAAFVTSSDSTAGDGLYAALGSTRRIKEYSNTFRVLASFPVGDETPFNRQGVLILNQLGFTPHHTHNWAYITLLGGINEFRSAARAPSTGGPLGTAGLLFGAVGLGRYGAALGNIADNAVGAAIGYQMFFGHFRRSQLVLELGGRYTYKDNDEDASPLDIFFVQDRVAGAARYAFAVGQRGVVTFDGFSAFDFTNSDNSIFNIGGRVEFTLNL